MFSFAFPCCLVCWPLVCLCPCAPSPGCVCVCVCFADLDPSIGPTVGFSAPVKKSLDGADLVFYDLGGGNRIRGVWPSFFADVRPECVCVYRMRVCCVCI